MMIVEIPLQIFELLAGDFARSSSQWGLLWSDDAVNDHPMYSFGTLRPSMFPRQILKQCELCDELYYDPPISDGANRYCSDECLEEALELRRLGDEEGR